MKCWLCQKANKINPKQMSETTNILHNEGFGCDKGIVLVDYGNVVFWKDKDNNKYCSPRDSYNIKLIQNAASDRSI